MNNYEVYTMLQCFPMSAAFGVEGDHLKMTRNRFVYRVQNWKLCPPGLILPLKQPMRLSPKTKSLGCVCSTAVHGAQCIATLGGVLLC